MFQDKEAALWRYECKKLQETSGLRAVELFGSTIKLPVATSMLPYDKAASAGNCEKASWSFQNKRDTLLVLHQR